MKRDTGLGRDCRVEGQELHMGALRCWMDMRGYIEGHRGAHTKD